eukprot:1233244-Pleurochrysis_carterae.AAC.1
MGTIAPVVDAVVEDPRAMHAAQCHVALGVVLDLIARKIDGTAPSTNKHSFILQCCYAVQK